MSSDEIDSRSEVSGGQTTTLARIRRELDVDDGDRLHWRLEADDTVTLRVARQQTRIFADFDGYDGKATTDVTNEHDAWGVDTE